MAEVEGLVHVGAGEVGALASEITILRRPLGRDRRR
jgi:hypothetical protein